MATILDYITWRGDISFEKDPFCEVDSLILCTLSYVDFDFLAEKIKETHTISIKEAGETFARHFADEKMNPGRILPALIYDLFDMMSRALRYRDLKLSYYINQIDPMNEKQFAALVIDLSEDEFFVAFRGTDDSIIGWKEDFNMCFKSPVPSQLQAAEYLDYISTHKKGKIILGGHSKGGNLAIFAAAFCQKKVRDRITGIYNFDGPGFTKEILDEIVKRDTLSRVRTIVPQSSIIGMLMEHDEQFEVVESSSKGIFQHDPFSWEVLGPHFVEVDDISARAYQLDHTLRDFLAVMEVEQKKDLIESMFRVLTKTGATTLSDITIKELPSIMKNMKDEDADKKQVLLQAFKLFLHIAHGKRIAEEKK